MVNSIKCLKLELKSKLKLRSAKIDKYSRCLGAALTSIQYLIIIIKSSAIIAKSIIIVTKYIIKQSQYLHNK